MASEQIGSASIKLVVDSSAVAPALEEVKQQVERATAEVSQGAAQATTSATNAATRVVNETAQATVEAVQNVKPNIEAAKQAVTAETKKIGERIEKDVGGGFERATGAVHTFQQAMTGIMAGVGIVTAVSKAAEMLATVIHAAGSAAEAAAAQYAKLNSEILATPAGEDSVRRLRSEIENIDQALAGLDSKNPFSQIYDDLVNTRDQLLSQRQSLVEDLQNQEKIAGDKLVLAEAANAKKRAEAIRRARLEGFDKINQDEIDALNEVGAREKAINESSTNDKLKAMAREALEQERMAIREDAAEKRRKQAAEDAQRSAEAKAKSEQESARAMEAQTRESERRAQVESQARAQAQRDQMLANALDRQAVALDKVLQAIQLQTEITKSLRRVL